jgi:hypothetical protein
VSETHVRKIFVDVDLLERLIDERAVTKDERDRLRAEIELARKAP